MAAHNLNIGVVGTGYWGKNLVRNLNELGVLRAICDVDTDALARISESYPDIAARASFDTLLDDPDLDAVVISTPAVTHARLVREALSAGKDVFVEKPLCLSVEEGRELVALAAERSRILMVGHLLWYHPAVLKLKELVDEGALGRIQYIYSNRLSIGKIRREENILWSFAPHDISVILGLINEEPDLVMAQGGNYLHQQVADATVSLLSFPSGVRAHIFVSWLHPFKEQKLIVVGDRGMAVFDDVETENKLCMYPHTIDWKERVPVAHKVDAQPVPIDDHEPLRAECEHFLHCVATRETPRTDGVEGLRVLNLLQRCQAALDDGGPQRLAGVPGDATPHQIHETAVIDADVSIGDGTSIWHFSHVLKGSEIGSNCKIGQNVVIGPKVRVGDGVKIQNNVSVYEGVTLEDHVFCGPSVVFTNVINPRSEIPRMSELRPTLVRRGATLGANCTILCGTTIGRYALVGAGATVTHDVPDNALVYGSPATLKGWVCRCGEKLKIDGDSASCDCGAKYVVGGESIRPLEAGV
ncbi:MAG: Gfo/Idh/MocA family oxidoreductase [Verrucomicrobia bacterium]|nr:Gfo/Idh/MocA family oxidoreductase [Verrucomicrobiota bacterium]MDA1086872.1 Gfo/Idh/MocA family oxidoreductase [Verrucomicrobiota bacterium]